MKERIIIKHLILETESSHETSKFMQEFEELLEKYAGNNWHYKWSVEG